MTNLSNVVRNKIIMTGLPPRELTSKAYSIKHVPDPPGSLHQEPVPLCGWSRNSQTKHTHKDHT